VFCLGTNIISWCSRKHNSIALSSAEAEYISANKVVCQSMWLRRILSDLHQKVIDPTVILYKHVSNCNDQKSSFSYKIKTYAVKASFYQKHG
jgi:hypothetical protein